MSEGCGTMPFMGGLFLSSEAEAPHRSPQGPGPDPHVGGGTSVKNLGPLTQRETAGPAHQHDTQPVKEHAVLTDLSPELTAPMHTSVPDAPTPAPEPTQETPAERLERFKSDAIPLAGKLFGFARNKTGSEAIADDLVQQTYERAWRAFDSFEPGTNIAAWLFTILKRLIANHYRSLGNQPQSTSIDDMSDWQELHTQTAVPHAFSSAETIALETMPDSEVVAALQALPEQFRLPVYLADAEGFSYKEISEMLDIPMGTVMSRLHRGRARLRESLYDVAIDRGVMRPRAQEGEA